MRLVSDLATVLLALFVGLAEAENTIGNDISYMERSISPNVRSIDMTAMANVTALNETVIALDEIVIQQIPPRILPLHELKEFEPFQNTPLENGTLWEGNHNENRAIGITAVRHALVLKEKAKQLKQLLFDCFIDGNLDYEKYQVARVIYEQLTKELQESVLSRTERTNLNEIMSHIHISILFSDIHANRVHNQHYGKSCMQAGQREE